MASTIASHQMQGKERSSLQGAGQQILGIKQAPGNMGHPAKFGDNSANNNNRTPDEISDDDLDDMGDDPMMHAEPTFGSNSNAQRPSLNSDNKAMDARGGNNAYKNINSNTTGKNSNPFNQRRQTATEAAGAHNNTSDKLDRKNTTGTLNRHESQSQLTNFDMRDNSHEVELKAQRDENSPLFQDSLMQGSNQSGHPQGQMGQNQQLGSRYYPEAGTQGNGMAGNQASHLMHIPAVYRRVTINLEDVFLEEQKLYQILDALRDNRNASLHCDDWWDVTEQNHFIAVIGNQILKDPLLKQCILRAQKQEIIAIGIVQFYHLLAYEQTTIDTQTSVNTYLKNLMFQIHQNFLIIVQITLSRITNRQGGNGQSQQYGVNGSTSAQMMSSWEYKLKNVIQEKAQKHVKTHNETAALLKVFCSNSDNIIRNIAQANQNKQLFKIIGDWMNQLPRVPLERIRDVLYNIEQFRGDALKLPEIQIKGNIGAIGAAPGSNGLNGKNGSSDGGPVYGAGAKSAGSINDTQKKSSNAGQTSLTGKNPFAILKASAIASNTTAQFPNNFTNLPKVYPPFLGPIEDNKTYCLVLDLDETLIHNVEYGAESFFLVRPGAVNFIETMAKYYEIVIFTAALQEYADQVIDQIDVGNNIKYRLYRQHTSQNGPFLVKDLSLLGRPLSKTIIIDNISDNFIIQPDNGIFISTWYDDMSDRYLDEITPLLAEIVEKNCPDVRKAMRQYRDQLLRQVVQGNSKPTITFD